MLTGPLPVALLESAGPPERGDRGEARKTGSWGANP